MLVELSDGIVEMVPYAIPYSTTTKHKVMEELSDGITNMEMFPLA